MKRQKLKKLPNGQSTFLNELTMREICSYCKNRFKCLVRNKYQCQINPLYAYAQDFYTSLSKYVQEHQDADIRKIPAVRITRVNEGLQLIIPVWIEQLPTHQDGVHLMIHDIHNTYILTDGELSKR